MQWIITFRNQREIMLVLMFGWWLTVERRRIFWYSKWKIRQIKLKTNTNYMIFFVPRKSHFVPRKWRFVPRKSLVFPPKSRSPKITFCSSKITLFTVPRKSLKVFPETHIPRKSRTSFKHCFVKAQLKID